MGVYFVPHICHSGSKGFFPNWLWQVRHNVYLVTFKISSNLSFSSAFENLLSNVDSILQISSFLSYLRVNAFRVFVRPVSFTSWAVKETLRSSHLKRLNIWGPAMKLSKCINLWCKNWHNAPTYYSMGPCTVNFLPDILQESARVLFSYFLFSFFFDLFGASAIVNIQKLVQIQTLYSQKRLLPASAPKSRAHTTQKNAMTRVSILFESSFRWGKTPQLSQIMKEFWAMAHTGQLSVHMQIVPIWNICKVVL